MGGGVIKNTADVSQKKFRLGPTGATPAESNIGKVHRPSRIDMPVQPKKAGK
jgi:hypothetical protein